MILELHLLQSFPASNLNRDDLGQPKTVTMGGHTRARISSQCLKRAARGLFQDYGIGRSETGVRTKRLLGSTVDVLAAEGRDAAQARTAVITGLGQLGFGVDVNRDLTEYLLFVNHDAPEHLARYCDTNWDSLLQSAATEAAEEGKKAGSSKVAAKSKSAKSKLDKAGKDQVRELLDARRSVDIALFGRMIADNKDLNVNAASQVAHAFSTHVVVPEFDFYTAVDDFKPDDESGADMIGTVDFNSACYYRYANLDVDRLTKNLGGDRELAQRGAAAWVHSFINAVPNGKQSSMAARTMPETLLGVTRTSGAWNLANAFFTPVTDHDVMAASTERLLKHYAHLANFYGPDQIRAAGAASVAGVLPDTKGITPAATVGDLVATMLDPVFA
ncbi:type I-E CRISPR-associated protein Cas7/Cse4/CasC [Actinokineospora diospyrosa]|uniref:CRISPR system Cascade subunit CasC n=1 Tax=Actinokineospora diospyrosa TaxID=103728 RepID=A0ABT1ICA4_9PSEU|nr:type I-E CRISPR-associated protein Cas7/Cse4/CasC [Actinokineospora diospyrosa]MCP2270254.1 CRISPR system Cascade subunit CasC [Actinokineospora diospyrosa]